jgi:hypothetical protein
MKKLFIALGCMVMLAACGGGGGGGTTPTPTTGFTTAMVSGKIMTSPHGTDVDTTVNKSDGTWYMTRTNPSAPTIVIGSNSGTWSINSSGQLISTKTATTFTDVVLNVPNTITLVSSTSTGVTLSSNGNTVVYTYVDGTVGSGFTSSMLSGKSLTSPHGTTAIDTTVLNPNGTWTKTRANLSAPTVVVGTSSGTWSINSIGDLISTTTASTYTDVVLNVPNTIKLVSYTTTSVTMFSNNTTVIFTFL